MEEVDSDTVEGASSGDGDEGGLVVFGRGVPGETCS